MIGAIIGGVLAVGSAIAGGIASAKANKEAEDKARSEKQRLQNWYDAEVSKDYTQRADMQNALNRQRELYAERLRNLAGAKATGGATEAAVAAEKQQITDSIAQTTGDVAAMSEQAKDRAENIYMQGMSDAAKTEMALAQQDAANIANATTSAIGAGAQIAAADTTFGAGNADADVPEEPQEDGKKKKI